MTTKQFEEVLGLIGAFKEIPTWTKKKKQLFGDITKIMESGTHEYFSSDAGSQHGLYKGDFYIEEKGHLRRGTLMKYRGKKVMILCTGQGSHYTRYYLVSVVEN